MRDLGEITVESWTVQYGYDSEPEVISVPHAWRQDLPVNDEGPVFYRTSLEVPKSPYKLRFLGVSCQAAVLINQVAMAEHLGIWDAFEVDLRPHSGTRIEIEVTVIKNGGPKFPVSEVASGFLPFVYHTFGGIFREVRLVPSDQPLEAPRISASRFHVEGSQVWKDGKPFYPRGVLHWGWYPDLGHPNPPDELILREIQQIKSLGFNFIKFCLWVPSHRFLELLDSEGLMAWMELPVWQPSNSSKALSQISSEVERIVRQYRHHSNIFAWTLGCELGKTVPDEFRRTTTQLIKNLTGAPLVKDSSGGAEAGAKSLGETGDFDDYHPYCDLPFFELTLDSFIPKHQYPRPLFLGEFNDADAHRDIAELANEIPYWGSQLTELNDQGVRWQYDLPTILGENRFANFPKRERHGKLMDSSRSQILFVRKTVHEWVRSRDRISGYVDTGWRDTPISTSGYLDDWNHLRFTPHEVSAWNQPGCLFVIPQVRTPWIHGGNRPVAVHPYCLLVGPNRIDIGLHSEDQVEAGLIWKIRDSEGHLVSDGASPVLHVPALRSCQVSTIEWAPYASGSYELWVEFGNFSNQWPITVTTSLSEEEQNIWLTDDPLHLFGFHSEQGFLTLSSNSERVPDHGLLVLTARGTVRRPFWRESAYEFREDEFWEIVDFENRWSKLLPISSDRFIDPSWLQSLRQPYQTLMNRVDVRTYQELPVIVRIGTTIVTTLCPFGDSGSSCRGIVLNPIGLDFIRKVALVLQKDIT